MTVMRFPHTYDETEMRKLVILTMLATLTCAAIFMIEVALSRREYAQRKQLVEALTATADRYRDTKEKGDLEVLIGALDSTDSHTRSTAAALLRQLGPLAAPAVDPLITLVEGLDSQVKREAILALGAIGPSAERATPQLIEAMNRYPGADVGWFAAEALGRVADPQDQMVHQELQEALGTADHHLRASAAEALAELKQRSAPTTNPAH